MRTSVHTVPSCTDQCKGEPAPQSQAKAKSLMEAPSDFNHMDLVLPSAAVSDFEPSRTLPQNLRVSPTASRDFTVSQSKPQGKVFSNTGTGSESQTLSTKSS